MGTGKIGKVKGMRVKEVGKREGLMGKMRKGSNER